MIVLFFQVLLFLNKPTGPTCWNCGGVGHFKSSCSSATTTTNSGTYTPNARTRGRGKPRSQRGRSRSKTRSFNAKKSFSNSNNNMPNDAHLTTAAEAHVLALHSQAASTDVPKMPLDNDVIIVDSGASSTLVCKPSWLQDIKETPRAQVTSASKTNDLCAVARGKLTLESSHGRMHIFPATLVEGLRVNLLSVSQLTDAQCRVTHDKNHCFIWHKTSKRIIGGAT